MSLAAILVLAFAYLALIFAIAWYFENKVGSKKSLIQNPYTYALSFAVYCTAWTFFGSVGRAANQGIDFLTIYLGPTLMAPLLWIILRKIIRISKVQKINSIADFIAARYGKSIELGKLVAVFLLLGVTPYIAIQIKAISNAIEVFSPSLAINKLSFYQAPVFYLVIVCAFIVLFFSAEKQISSGKNSGLIGAIAFESIIKLVAFLALGIYVTYFLFDGFSDIIAQASAKQNLEKLFSFSTNGNYSHWFWMIYLSFSGIILLPRQFQVNVVENFSESHIKKAIYLFPLYLFLINIFVMPVAIGGNVLFNGAVDADTYVLAIPLLFQNNILAGLVFIGGLSAATGMIIVSTLALSNMVSNNLLLPWMVNTNVTKLFGDKSLTALPVYTRRISIVLILVLAYSYFEIIANNYSIVSIGIISFVAVAQLGPAFIGGLFWKRATKAAAFSAIIIGFLIWFFTLVFPTMIQAGWFSKSILIDGLFGIKALNPNNLFGLSLGDAISSAAFWSISLNLITFFGVSLFTSQSSVEHNQAEIFVEVFRYSSIFEKSVLWRGTAYIPDIKSLLVQFLGKQKAETALDNYFEKFPENRNLDERADSTLVNYAENILTGHVGAASARILVSNIVTEENFTVTEVMDMLKETQQVISTNHEYSA